MVEDLLGEGYQSITVLDIATRALSSVKARLDRKAELVTWLEGDVTAVALPAHHYELWHDRAVFHFLTEPGQRAQYLRQLLKALKPDGHLIIGVFAPEAPPRCSGLPVQRYSRETIESTIRGSHPGLVHIISAMEVCDSYKPWHDKKTGRTFLRPDSGKCLHYYFYFIHAELGLCYLRVPTWCPFRLQFYFNGHNPLASKLTKEGVAHRLIDNAFVQIADFERAQRLADDMSIGVLHKALDQIVTHFCPVTEPLGVSYHWSIM